MIYILREKYYLRIDLIDAFFFNCEINNVSLIADAYRIK